MISVVDEERDMLNEICKCDFVKITSVDLSLKKCLRDGKIG